MRIARVVLHSCVLRLLAWRLVSRHRPLNPSSSFSSSFSDLQRTCACVRPCARNENNGNNGASGPVRARVCLCACPCVSALMCACRALPCVFVFYVCVLLGTLFRLRRIVAIWMDSYASTQFMHFVNPMVPVGDGKSDSTDQTMSLNMDHWRARSMHENKRPYHSRSRRYALNLSGVLFGRWYTHAVQKKTKQKQNKMVNTSR